MSDVSRFSLRGHCCKINHSIIFDFSRPPDNTRRLEWVIYLLLHMGMAVPCVLLPLSSDLRMGFVEGTLTKN